MAVWRPRRMKAIRFHQHGGPEVLRYDDVPTPQPGPQEVLVALRAAALNHLDLFVRDGIPGIALPHIPGSDGAGVVAAQGPGASRYPVGTRVFFDPGISDGTCRFCARGEHCLCDRYQILGEHRDGTYAQAVAIPEVNCRPIPERISFGEAAAFPLVFLTAWRLLMTKARVQPGEIVLILGIGGGVSLAALQIARNVGARVFVTSGNPKKLARAQELGAEVAIDHAKTDFSREVWSLTNKQGVDVIVDSVGAATWDKSIRALAKGGRMVVPGATSGPKPDVDIRRVFAKQVAIYGSTMGTRPDWEKVTSLLESGKLRPIVDRTFPWEHAAEAQTVLARAEQFGKLVLEIPALA